MNESSKSQQEVFALLFQLANQLQAYLDWNLKPDALTAKQFFLMIVIHSFGTGRPGLKQLAERFGSSHQNVKQLVLKLQSSGFVDLQTDPLDRRAQQISLTDKARKYWAARDAGDELAFRGLFTGFEPELLESMSRGLQLLRQNLRQLDRVFE